MINIDRNTARRAARLATFVGCAIGCCFAGGCVTSGPHRPAQERLAAEAARPLLTLDPNSVWADAYNRLVELGPTSLAYLMQRPEMTRPAAPDDLSVLIHTSLVRILAGPQSGVPRLSATCFETTLDLLHFDLKVEGAPLGTIVILPETIPLAWPSLYPANFDHLRAARIDLEADRRALQQWWKSRREMRESLVTNRRLQPRPEQIWRLLGRRYADRWYYQPEPGAMLCSVSPQEPTLLNLPTVDYNLVRAACIWLGACPTAEVESHLIDLLAAPPPVVAHNARFALNYSRNEQVQSVLRRYPLFGQSK